MARSRISESVLRPGDPVDIEFSIDNFPVFEGGGKTVRFDPAVIRVNSMDLDATWNIANMPGTIDNALGQVTDILVATFPGVQTGFTVATIELEAVGVGLSSLELTDSTIENPWGSDGVKVNPQYINGSINVSAIPLPAAVWLFGTALAGVGFSIRNKGK